MGIYEGKKENYYKVTKNETNILYEYKYVGLQT
jgi:hypothetical protein